jgi:transcriptional regulator with XRE-family HTH domain
MDTKTELGKRIRKIRKEWRMSQEELAKKLNLHRPAISQIESGQRSVSSDELVKIAGLFDISLDDLMSSEKPRKTFERPGRVKLPRLNKEKFRQVLLYILEKCGSKPNVGETVIYKLLYFCDFNYYELYEEPLTGEAYKKITHGPAPCHFKEITEEMAEKGELKKVPTEYYGKPQKKYIAQKRADVGILSGRELKVIDEVIERLSSLNAGAIEDYSHQDTPWQIAKDKEIMNYEAVFYRSPAYSVREYPEG